MTWLLILPWCSLLLRLWPWELVAQWAPLQPLGPRPHRFQLKTQEWAWTRRSSKLSGAEPGLAFPGGSGTQRQAQAVVPPTLLLQPIRAHLGDKPSLVTG